MFICCSRAPALGHRTSCSSLSSASLVCAASLPSAPQQLLVFSASSCRSKRSLICELPLQPKAFCFSLLPLGARPRDGQRAQVGQPILPTKVRPYARALCAPFALCSPVLGAHRRAVERRHYLVEPRRHERRRPEQVGKRVGPSPGRGCRARSGAQTRARATRAPVRAADAPHRKGAAAAQTRASCWSGRCLRSSRYAARLTTQPTSPKPACSARQPPRSRPQAAAAAPSSSAPCSTHAASASYAVSDAGTRRHSHSAVSPARPRSGRAPPSGRRPAGPTRRPRRARRRREDDVLGLRLSPSSRALDSLRSIVARRRDRRALRVPAVLLGELVPREQQVAQRAVCGGAAVGSAHGAAARCAPARARTQAGGATSRAASRRSAARGDRLAVAVAVGGLLELHRQPEVDVPPISPLPSRSRPLEPLHPESSGPPASR